MATPERVDVSGLMVMGTTLSELNNCARHLAEQFFETDQVYYKLTENPIRDLGRPNRYIGYYTISNQPFPTTEAPNSPDTDQEN